VKLGRAQNLGVAVELCKILTLVVLQRRLQTLKHSLVITHTMTDVSVTLASKASMDLCFSIISLNIIAESSLSDAISLLNSPFLSSSAADMVTTGKLMSVVKVVVN
jgi:hypothetical protein